MNLLKKFGDNCLAGERTSLVLLLALCRAHWVERPVHPQKNILPSWAFFLYLKLPTRWCSYHERHATMLQCMVDHTNLQCLSQSTVACLTIWSSEILPPSSESITCLLHTWMNHQGCFQGFEVDNKTCTWWKESYFSLLDITWCIMIRWFVWFECTYTRTCICYPHW